MLNLNQVAAILNPNGYRVIPLKKMSGFTKEVSIRKMKYVARPHGEVTLQPLDNNLILMYLGMGYGTEHFFIDMVSLTVTVIAASIPEAMKIYSLSELRDFLTEFYKSDPARHGVQ